MLCLNEDDKISSLIFKNMWMQRDRFPKWPPKMHLQKLGSFVHASLMCINQQMQPWVKEN